MERERGEVGERKREEEREQGDQVDGKKYGILRHG